MPRLIAVIPTNLRRTPLGLPSLLSRRIAGRTVLAHTVGRVARVKGIEAIVLVHPAGQDPLPLLEGLTGINRIQTWAVNPDPPDDQGPMRAAARRWAPHAWRGGLGGATCYDELLPARPLLEALRKTLAYGVLLVGADWLLVDPELCQRVVDLHLTQPEARQLTFCQAPPGLAGIVAGDKVIEQLAETPAGSFGQILGYVPSRPQPDPIGRDVCVQIDGAIRGCGRRFVYDNSRSEAMVDALAGRLSVDFASASAATVIAAVRDMETDLPGGWAPLPQWVTLELTPRRIANGPIVPQHYVKIDRRELDVELAKRIVGQLGLAGDTVLMLGGLGDPLLHAQWDLIVKAAHEAGVAGIGIQTDLGCEPETFSRLVELPIDLITVHVNGDRAATYEKVMGFDGFGPLIKNMQLLYERRILQQHRKAEQGQTGLPQGLPWIVPTMVKTADTLPDLENFYDKWTHLLGYAVIEPATSGCGLMPELSPVDMAPPRRQACRQLSRRMTILSDGRVARCDQDWLGQGAAGDANMTPLAEIWAAMHPLRAAHAAGRWVELDLCGKCRQWHRP